MSQTLKNKEMVYFSSAGEKAIVYSFGFLVALVMLLNTVQSAGATAFSGDQRAVRQPVFQTGEPGDGGDAAPAAASEPFTITLPLVNNGQADPEPATEPAGPGTPEPTDPGTSEPTDPGTPEPTEPGTSEELVTLPTSGPMKLVRVTNAESRQAICNDGTPAAYYIRRGQKNTSWIVHLQGGGYCSSKESCQERKNQEPELMTSQYDPSTRTGGGIQSTSTLRNADFAEYNHVFITYCSSDLWSGDRSASSETGGLHFRGGRIFKAVIEDLMNPKIIPTPNLAEAKQVIFSGTSAGGAGILVHLDWLTGRLPAAQVRGINDAGWFVDVSPYNKTLTPTRDQVQAAYKFWNGTVDADCAAANSGREGLCYMGPYAFPHIRTPLFVQIAQYDGPQLVAQGIQPPEDAAEVSYANGFAEAVRSSLQSVGSAFSPADQTHGLLTSDKFWTLRVNQKSLKDALHTWVFSAGSQIKLIGTGSP